MYMVSHWLHHRKLQQSTGPLIERIIHNIPILLNINQQFQRMREF